MLFSKKSAGQIWKRKPIQGIKKELYHKLTDLKINCQKANFMVNLQRVRHDWATESTQTMKTKEILLTGWYCKIINLIQFSSVAQSCLAALQASLSITNSWSSPKLKSMESVMPSNHLILCHPLLLPPSIFLSIRVFPNESVLHIRWPKYWSFSISPSNEYSGLISFRMDGLDLLVVQGTLKSLFQHHSSEASILRPTKFHLVKAMVFPVVMYGCESWSI